MRDEGDGRSKERWSLECLTEMPAKEPLVEAMRWTRFHTGDAETDRLLESASQRIALPKEEDRWDALEKLWGAFERLKTLEPGSSKRS